jgi:hypothetical protein
MERAQDPHIHEGLMSGEENDSMLSIFDKFSHSLNSIETNLNVLIDFLPDFHEKVHGSANTGWRNCGLDLI